MCESTIFLEKDGEREIVMRDVARILADGDRIKLIGILGEEVELIGEITLVDSVKHEVVVRER